MGTNERSKRVRRERELREGRRWGVREKDAKRWAVCETKEN